LLEWIANEKGTSLQRRVEDPLRSRMPPK
jgi:hypothetical protein